MRYFAELHLLSQLQESQAIMESFYMEDFLSGTATVLEVDSLHKQLHNRFSKAGLIPHK